MRVTVTGATGFIGGHLLERLFSDGYQVTALVRNPVAIPLLKARGITAVRGQVEDPASLERAMTGSQVVFSLARAKAHGARPSEAFVVNVEGARNVARAAARSGVTRVVHCSSAAVYGSRVGLVEEKARLRPDSAYARSKARGESVLIDECAGGTELVLARITAVLGPGCMSWLSLFRSAALGKLRLVGDGLNMHHPADVSDVVEGLMRCAFIPAAAGNAYNIAGPEPVSVAGLRSALAKAVIEASGASAEVVHPRPYFAPIINAYYRFGRLTDSIAGVRPPLFDSVSFLTADRVLDLRRARAELGFAPVVGVDEAARRTADWYKREGLL